MPSLKEIVNSIKRPDPQWAIQAQARLDSLTKPLASLGRLEDLARQVVSIRGELHPKILKKYIITAAGDHGVVKEGVSAFPSEVTPQMVSNFLRGGAAINALAKQAGAEVIVVDAGVASDLPPHPGLMVKKIRKGTDNMVSGPAMSRDEAEKIVLAGVKLVQELAAKGADLIGTGEMGIGNTTPSSAIVAVIAGSPVAEVTGRGTGVDDEGLFRKIAIIEKAIQFNRPDKLDGLDVLSKVGGFEIGFLAGVFLGCALMKVPVVIDGFISGAAALIAATIAPEAIAYFIPSHCSVERGHRVTLDYLGLKPLMEMEMRLGEGTGAALGMMIVESALRVYNEMATFAEAGVSDKS